MDRLTELLGILDDLEQVAALTSDELVAYRTEMLSIAEGVLSGSVTPADGQTVVDVLSQIAEYAAPDDGSGAMGGITYVLAVRDAEATERQAQIDAAALRLGLSNEPPAGDEPPAAPAAAAPAAPSTSPPAVGAPAGGQAAPAAPAVAAPPAAPEAAPAPERAPALSAVVVADPPPAAAPAALPALGELAGTGPAGSQPRITVGEPRIMHVETGEMVDLDELVGIAIEKIDRFQGMSGDSIEKVPLGRIKVAYPEDHQIHKHDVDSKLAMQVDEAWRPDRWTVQALTAAGVSDPVALLASGGWCAPAQPDYDIPQIAGTQRPVQGSLNRSGMDRGQVIVVQPPKLVDVTSDTAHLAGSAVSIWTAAVDTTPAGATKPYQTMACPSPKTIALQAIVEQIQIGNFEARSFPELVKTIMANTASAWARRAESQLLAQIDTNSTAITTPQALGATGEFLAYLSELAAAIRNRNRMDPNAVLRLLLPRWFVDFVAADQARLHPGDGFGRYTVGEAEVRTMLASRNVNVTFYEDQSDAGGAVAQIFGAQGATAIRHFPPGGGVATPQLVWFLHPEGTFSAGDGGTLDLGIVRDSTLNATNDYRFFSESWEAVIPKVIEAYKVTSNLCATGSYAGDVTSSCSGTS